MVMLQVKVIPRSSKARIIKEKGIIKIKLVSPPKNGKANKELKEFLSKKLGVPKRNINIISGLHLREKRIRVEGLSLEEVLDKLD